MQAIRPVSLPKTGNDTGHMRRRALRDFSQKPRKIACLEKRAKSKKSKANQNQQIKTNSKTNSKTKSRGAAPPPPGAIIAPRPP
ncbi:hypothetical protein [Candidatus Magnetaquiglobus chichijimensis]|uniref:hypothetical protein n=1 Tax=Candidatus Magnetaquiglobus chichijimensis TaxID=3141448 RepID=UPI003B978FF9